jgi:hypothetical protein
MLGHLCALYDRGVFEAGRLMSNLLFQLAVKRKQTNTPLLEQARIPDTFRIVVDEKTLSSNLPSAATLSPLVGLMFGLRPDAGKMVPAAHWLPAVLSPGPAPTFAALSVDAWLDEPVIPTTQKTLSRRDLINAVRDQDGGAHSDPDAKLQKSMPMSSWSTPFPLLRPLTYRPLKASHLRGSFYHRLQCRSCARFPTNCSRRSIRRRMSGRSSTCRPWSAYSKARS